MNMLEVNFLNVGDGDAALLRLTSPGAPPRDILIDTGRPAMTGHPLSRKATAAEHLRELGVEKLALLVITHLHIDHMGGAADILAELPVEQMVVPYVPAVRARELPLRQQGDLFEKWNELCRVLLRWQETLDKARARGTVIRTAWEAPVFSLDGLTVEEILPGESIQAQAALYDRIYRGKRPAAEAWYPVTKRRNPESLMERVLYGGRQLLFCGDRYAETVTVWPYGRCDLVKLAHHGDPKAMTAPLLEVLRPEWGIISCQLDPRKNKDRPNQEILDLLRRGGVKVFCTENREMAGQPLSTARRIVCRIRDDGGMEIHTVP